MTDLNSISLSGRVPFDVNAIAPKEEDGHYVVMFKLSVKRNFKKKEEKYYPEDLIACKAFGPLADYIQGNIVKGDQVIVGGRVEESTYTGKDGTEHVHEMYVNVQELKNLSYKKDDSGEEKNTATRTKSSETVKNPLLNPIKKGANPLKSSKIMNPLKSR